MLVFIKIRSISLTVYLTLVYVVKYKVPKHFINCLFNVGIRSKIRSISLNVYLTLVYVVKYEAFH